MALSRNGHRQPARLKLEAKPWQLARRNPAVQHNLQPAIEAYPHHRVKTRTKLYER